MAARAHRPRARGGEADAPVEQGQVALVHDRLADHRKVQRLIARACAPAAALMQAGSTQASCTVSSRQAQAGDLQAPPPRRAQRLRRPGWPTARHCSARPACECPGGGAAAVGTGTVLASRSLAGAAEAPGRRIGLASSISALLPNTLVASPGTCRVTGDGPARVAACRGVFCRWCASRP